MRTVTWAPRDGPYRNRSHVTRDKQSHVTWIMTYLNILFYISDHVGYNFTTLNIKKCHEHSHMTSRVTFLIESKVTWSHYATSKKHVLVLGWSDRLVWGHVIKPLNWCVSHVVYDALWSRDQSLSTVTWSIGHVAHGSREAWVTCYMCPDHVTILGPRDR